MWKKVYNPTRTSNNARDKPFTAGFQKDMVEKRTIKRWKHNKRIKKNDITEEKT